ncbi:magnesium transporter CorA family protein [Patescibacteria group bacterium]|nr:magnesium transporter CorA family protein [Patescibacteria group bacterium]
MVAREKAISYKNLKWFDFANPDKKTVNFLAENFKFHPLDLEDCLTEIQRPKIDEYSDYLFIVLHFPIWNQNTGRVTTEEVDIFIGQNFVITLHKGVLLPLEKIREECGGESGCKKYLERGSGYFLYQLTSKLFDYCFPILDKMWKSARRLEGDVFDEEGVRDLLKDIMLLKKNIITFRRILQPERPVISALEHKNKKFLPEALEVYFDDVVDKIEKQWSSLDSLKEMAETLQDANESLISHRSGETIKVLTIFSVIMLPLTLISGIFGMNVGLPFQKNVDAFLGIAGMMLVVAGVMFIYFRWKKWW